jgi:hypothetical protein
MCHSERMKFCKRDSDDWKEYYKSSDRNADKGRYHQQEKEDWYNMNEHLEADDVVKKPDQDKRTRYEEESRQEEEKPKYRQRQEKQTHVHEFEGSTKLAEFEEDVHNHRVAGISGEAIKIPGSHVHKIWTRTDYFDHFHYIQQFSGPAIYVDMEAKDTNSMMDEEPHVHFATGLTSINDGHNHEWQLATLIDSPLLPETEVV